MSLRSTIVLAASGTAIVVACRTPTQITLAISTDVACHPNGPPRMDGTSIYAGAPDTVAGRQVTSTRACTTGAPLNRIGDMAIVPSGDGDNVALQVVAGIDRPVEECTPDDDYAGCIVARRVLRYIPHRQLQLPVILLSSCVGKPCPSDSTCLDGVCVDATVLVDRCFDDVCDSQSLTGGGTTATSSGAGGSGVGGAGGSSSVATSGSSSTVGSSSVAATGSSSSGGCTQTQCNGYCCDTPGLPLCGSMLGECCEPQMGGQCYNTM